jgi:hypothetical protein
MRRVAFLTLLTFGCATVRPPADRVAPPPVSPRRLALAEPQLELWIEGTRAVDPREKEEALSRSRDALARALDAHGLDAQDPEEIVVVRARELARTGERKSAQTWSVVGIVVGIVAVVAVAVILATRGGGKSSSKAARSSSAGGHAALPAPARGARAAVPRPAYVYAPAPPVNFFVGFDFAVPIGPYAPPEALPAPGVPDVQATGAWLANRGWFDGDEVELTVEGTDPATGALRWRRIVKEGIDPRDPAAVARLVDRALAGVESAEVAPGAPPSYEPPPPPDDGALPPPPPPLPEELPAPAQPAS